ncbi:MAG: hybrid sensor histidine kinase/response regulator [Desulfobacterales bacterium]
MDNTKFRILIVDDNPKNIQVVGNLLSQEGYPSAFALSGTQALEICRQDRFDLILLDIMMPGMDGFEVCEYLKKQDETKDIPIIFLTAKADTDSMVKGFDLGAYDYVTKPFIGRELLARVRTQLYIKSLNDELKERYEKIQQLESMRETLTSMIIHDLKNPLSGISGYAHLLRMNPTVAADPKAFVHAGSILNSTQTMLDMIMAILDVSKMESGQMELNMENTDIRRVLRQAVEGLTPLLKESGVRLKINLPGDIPELRADSEILRRILVNLMGNAIHFSPADSHIIFSALSQESEVRISVADQGPGIPKEFREKIFEKFRQADSSGKKKKYSTGLGLAFCKMAVEAMEGQIGVDSESGKGSTFWFVLPSAGEKRRQE